MRDIVMALYRVRGPLYYLAAAVLIGNAVTAGVTFGDNSREIRVAIALCGVVLAAMCVLLAFLGPRFLKTRPARLVQAPVRGRWLGMNSPASKVPSHGVRAYGQAYAIDLVCDPLDDPRPEFGGPFMRSNVEYPAFGQPVVAMIDGAVVSTSSWRRDHRARSNGWGIIYLMIEGMIREIGGPGFIVGNHVTIRGDDGVYATVAHLQRGSIRVAIGDVVTAGSTLGMCGNSGNSSEPHVHAQLMDRASLWTAQGLPMSFSEITIGDSSEVSDSLPENGQHLTAVAHLNGENH